jgi:argininosuccinate lyase
MTEAKNLWGGRFSGKADPGFAAFNNSLRFDQRLFEADVVASIAYCRALVGAGVFTAEESQTAVAALEQILADQKQNADYFKDSAAEDVHSFVESKLVELTGDLGRKLHTGRSRNDQVATDFRLWLRQSIDSLASQLQETQSALLGFAESNLEIVIPGYTHLQRAQPVLLAHWCLAYFEMFARDHARLSDARRRVNVLPLGAAALAGNSFPIDRKKLANDLGFEAISQNSLDAVSDRDFCVDFLSACSLIMVHLSRLAEDIIIYSTTEFGLIELGDAIATGSSLMPQKKNPDSMELVRGKAGRVFGDLMGLLSTLKGLPLAYNKDMQEDKEAVFDALDTTATSLQVTQTVLSNIQINKERASTAAVTGYMNATELADYLVRKGMPFRDAHETVGKVVVDAIGKGVELDQLPLEDFRSHSDLIEGNVYTALSLDATLDAKRVVGGTSRKTVATALAEAKDSLTGEASN